MEGLGQHLDELTEVDALVGDIIEDGLIAVALILYVANFHLQAEVFGNLSALYHRRMLTALSLLIFLHVDGLSDAIDALDVVGRLQVGFFQLQTHETAGERYHADVVTGVGLHGNDVAFLQVEVVDIMVIALAGVLKLHLDQVGRLGVARHVGQPVVGIELLVLPPHAFVGKAATATGAYIEVSHFI